MNKERISNIINEEINKVIAENSMEEANHEVANLIKHYMQNRNKDSQDKKKYRKRKGGGKEYYDYHDYELKNKKISLGDASSIRNTIDTEKTNIAAVARDLFPDHTEEGAQSQLRKILNGERPMTKNIASKIEKMISSGQIAVK